MLLSSCKSVVRSLVGLATCGLWLAMAAAPLPAGAKAAPKAQVSQLTELQMLDQRVADIGWKLATLNLELCPVHFAATGITLHSASQYNASWRSSAVEAFGFEQGKPAVLAVAKGSPAWNSGIRPNDIIVSLNGVALGRPDAKISAKGNYSETDSAMALVESVKIGEPVVLGVERGDDRIALDVMPVESCASRFEMATSNQLNANSNGRVVQVFGRLVVALSSDDDLALVMAHELAHNTLGHNQSIKSRRLSTSLFAAFNSSGKVLRDFELQADRYGIFMAARAGFAYSHAAAFWKRFASTGGISAWIAITHPSPRNRERKAQAAVDEVNLLVAQHKPLIPLEYTDRR